MDEIPTIIELLKSKSVEYRQTFHQRALELEHRALSESDFRLAALYGEIIDQYLDAFESFDLLEMEDFEPLEVQHDY